MSDLNTEFPALPLAAWAPTQATLHRYLQIVGKIRMALTPRQNHWWHATLRVNSRGLFTPPIPYGNFSFDIQFNFIDHRLEINCSQGQSLHFDLVDGLSVAEFYRQLMAALAELGVTVAIVAKPYDLGDSIPFNKAVIHHSYDAMYVERFWQVLRQVDQVFTTFSGRSYSKTSPVQLFWHHMDLAVTRFSGKAGPAMPNANIADREAYSHEVISCGFWAGDTTVTAPAFYAYAYPSPADLDKDPLQPSTAQWMENNGSPMALLMYDDIRQTDNPREQLLTFLESAYTAAAKRAHWPIDELRIKPM